MTRWSVVLLLAVAVGGCRASKAPAPKSSSSKPAATAKPAPAKPTVAKAPPPRPAIADGGTALDPDHFVGFSADESEFAWSSYSSGAGFSILTIVSSTTGARVTDLPLDSKAAEARARGLLEKAGFVGAPRPASAVLPKGTHLGITVAGGVVHIALARGARSVALRPGRDFLETSKHFGAPKAALWGFSPKGTYAAVRLTQSAGAELGTAVAYHVVDVKTGLERLDAASGKK